MRGLVALLLMLLPTLAWAGAWPREVGRVFLSASATARSDRASIGAAGFPQEIFAAFYLEYGLTPNITVGLDASHDDKGDFTALAFMRRPIGRGENGHVFALKAGAGTTRTGSTTQSLVMAGFDWGRGFETGLGNGWLSLETGLYYRTGQGELAAKADLTLGLKPSDRTKLMLQVQAGQYPGGDAYLRLVPSVALQIREGAHVELGLAAGLAGDDRLGVKIGTWLEF